MNFDLSHINFELQDIIYTLIGFVLASIICFFQISKLKKDIKTLKKQYEKKSIGMDDSSLRVKTLENKIQTLEAALKKQLGK